MGHSSFSKLALQLINTLIIVKASNATLLQSIGAKASHAVRSSVFIAMSGMQPPRDCTLTLKDRSSMQPLREVFCTLTLNDSFIKETALHCKVMWNDRSSMQTPRDLRCAACYMTMPIVCTPASVLRPVLCPWGAGRCQEGDRRCSGSETQHLRSSPSCAGPHEVRD